MEALISTPKLYDLLSAKIGKQTAEALLLFIKGGIKNEMEYQIKALATNENLFKVNGMLKEDVGAVRNELKDDIRAVRTELKEDIAAVRTELKEDIAAVRDELKQDIATVRTELTEDIAGFRDELKNDIVTVRTELKDDAGDLRVHIEKGFRQQFWLILVLFLPLYFTLILLLVRLL